MTFDITKCETMPSGTDNTRRADSIESKPTPEYPLALINDPRNALRIINKTQPRFAPLIPESDLAPTEDKTRRIHG